MKRSAIASVLTGAGILGCVANFAAFAEGSLAGGEASTNTAGQLEEIVVTARFRQENLLEVPAAITAIGARDLEARDIGNVQNLGAAVPNIFVAPASGAVGATPTISMRGVYQLDFNFAFEPGVGVYIDDVYHPTLMGSALDLMDINRVEVLRGPQGTLFGKSNMGGAIRLFSNVPTGSDTGYAELGYGSYNRMEVKAGYDMAIIPDKLFLRVSGASKKVDGYVRDLDFVCQMKNLGTPNLIPAGLASHAPSNSNCSLGTEGGESLQAGRVMLRYVATDKLEFNVTADRTRDDRETNPNVLIGTESTAPLAAPTNGALPPYAYDNRFIPPNHYSTYDWLNNTPNVASVDEWGVSESTSYAATDHLRLKAILAYRTYDSDFSFNPDSSPYGFSENWNVINHDQYTAELQVTGEAFEDRLEWAMGGFYLKESNYLGGHVWYAGLSFDQDDRYKDSNKAGFLHATYRLTDNLSITAGGRYSADDKSYSFHHPGLTPVPLAPIYRSLSETRPDWTTNIEYKFTNDVAVYGTVATGYRPGGINPRPIIVPDQLVPFGAEKLTSYEAGLKTSLFDHRLTANIAGFYSDYSKHLVAATEFECAASIGSASPTPVTSPAACPGGNAVPWFAYASAPAKIYGAEFEAQAEPIERLRLNFDLGYSHFVSSVTNPLAVNYVSPANLVQPEINFSAGIQYEVPMSFGGFVTPRLDWNHTGKMTYNGGLGAYDPGLAGGNAAASYALTTQQAYNVANAKFTYSSADHKWQAVATVSNLFDTFYWASMFDKSGYALTGVPSRPREYLLSLKRSF